MKETGLRIRLFGDPAIRKKAKPVKKITQGHRDVLSAMSRLMYASSGIGLASSQVGVDCAMIVIDIGQGLYKLINPKIVKREGWQVLEEGCLSVPGICIKVKRAKKVLVQALDESGKPVNLEAEDLLACVLQHEIDHLKGKLIVDYASLFDKLKITEKLEGLKKRSENESRSSSRAGVNMLKEGLDELSESEAKSCKLQL